MINEEDKNNESKSLILAPFNTEGSNHDSDEEEEELDTLNEALKFEPLAKEGNIKYEKNF